MNNPIQVTRSQFYLTGAYVFTLLAFSDIQRYLPIFYIVTVIYISRCGIYPLIAIKKMPINTVAQYYIPLIIWVTISFAWQKYESYYLQRVLSMVLIFISTIPLSYMIYNKETCDTVINSTILAGVLALVFRIVCFGVTYVEGWNGVAITGAIIFAMCLEKYIRTKMRKYMFSMFLVVPIVLITASRRAIGYIIIPYIIIVFFGGKKFLKKFTITILLGLLALYIITTLPAFEYMRSRLLVMQNSSLFLTQDYSTIYRMALIEDGWEAFLKRPFIGYGVGYSFEEISYRIYNSKTYLHNNYLELLVGIGLIGAILFYSIHIRVFRLATALHDKLFKAFIISILVLFLIADIGSVSYYDKFTIWILTLVAIGGKVYGRNYSPNTDL